MIAAAPRASDPFHRMPILFLSIAAAVLGRGLQPTCSGRNSTILRTAFPLAYASTRRCSVSCSVTGACSTAIGSGLWSSGIATAHSAVRGIPPAVDSRKRTNRLFVPVIGENRKYSYSIYLWHFPLILMLQKYGIMKLHSALILYDAVCILVGIGFAKLIEEPSLRLRDYLTQFIYPISLSLASKSASAS
jgi:peptidoglycan/LPS O-acetylase OafA/YrhL